MATEEKNFSSYLNKMPQNVDAVICEGTNAGKDGVNLKEVELENKMVDVMEHANQVFVLMSALNIDRVVTVYKAANKVKTYNAARCLYEPGNRSLRQ